MHPDLVPGAEFPDIVLPEHTGRELSLSRIANGKPLVLCFVRGWWCPKEQVRVRNLVEMQEEIQREYGTICAVTVDEPYVNGAFRAGVGADFPWLSDEDRGVAEALDLIELPDYKHRPYLPLTFVLDSRRRIERIWCGFWFWGNPTPEELRQTLRAICRREQPTFEPQPVWGNGGSGSPGSGVDVPAVWVREDDEGREIMRGIWKRDGLPAVGEAIGRSTLDGRAWVVREVRRDDGHVGIYVRRQGERDESRLARHHVTVPR
jgi:peroxiredoxin